MDDKVNQQPGRPAIKWKRVTVPLEQDDDGTIRNEECFRAWLPGHHYSAMYGETLGEAMVRLLNRYPWTVV